MELRPPSINAAQNRAVPLTQEQQIAKVLELSRSQLGGKTTPTKFVKSILGKRAAPEEEQGEGEQPPEFFKKMKMPGPAAERGNLGRQSTLQRPTSVLDDGSSIGVPTLGNQGGRANGTHLVFDRNSERLQQFDKFNKAEQLANYHKQSLTFNC